MVNTCHPAHPLHLLVHYTQVHQGNFSWLDYLLPSPHHPAAYQQWATFLPDNTSQPTVNHSCLLANMSEAQGGASGWQPARCSTQHVYICKIIGGCGHAHTTHLRCSHQWPGHSSCPRSHLHAKLPCPAAAASRLPFTWLTY